jgi:beta-xylosidase
MSEARVVFWKEVVMKKNYLVLLLITVLFSACNTRIASKPTITDESVQLPSETPVPPTPTMEAQPTPLPSPTPDPVIFRDDFNGALEIGWQWVREERNFWSLTNNPGWLEIMAGSGYVIHEDVSNLLVRTAPNGDFELETRMKFKPTSNFQIAGLLIFESVADHMLFGRAYCDKLACADDGYYFDLITGGVYLSENYARGAAETATVYFRLRSEGDEFTGYVSEDGLEWRVIGTHTSKMNPLYVGLMVGQVDRSEPIPAQFDYFMITALQ